MSRGAELSHNRGKCRVRVSGLNKAWERGEGDRKADMSRRGIGGEGGGIRRGGGGAGKNEERVIDCGAGDIAFGAQGRCSSREGRIIQMAKADADGT